jgi:hypothetical protein
MISELVEKVGESLVDLILPGPEDQWGNIFAEAISHIGQVFLEMGDAIESETAH